MMKTKPLARLGAFAFAVVAAFGSLSAGAENDEDSRVGQYFCVVEYAAGIKKSEDHATFAGKITLPDGDRKFFVRIKPIELEPISRQLCAETAGSFQTSLQEGTKLRRHSGRLYGTESFSRVCLTNFTAEIPSKGSDSAWTYRGYGPYEFEGVDPNDNFTLYGTNDFKRTFPYDEGPVVQAGKCERIMPPK